MIIRTSYLNRVKKLIDTEFIKVITGVRRSGKSFLLMSVRDYLLSLGMKDKQIIYINFEDLTYVDLLEDLNLFQHIKNLNNNDRLYLLFDEIQEVNQWQKQINSMRVSFDCDIYITGSNATLLSGELSTYLTGRFVEIEMYPLSFKEYLEFKKYDLNQGSKYLEEYLKYGGYPSIVLQNEESLKKDVLIGIFQSILWRDIAHRSTIKDPDGLERIVKFLIDNIGNTVSTNKIVNTLKSHGKKISNPTVDSYLHFLVQSFMFYKVTRYDIRGKEYLDSQAKYYLVDLGFVLSTLGKSHSNRGSKIENLVFLELKRRKYDVFVGKYNTLEIDFVANAPDETLYIQVTDQIPKKSQRETNNLLHLPTGHRKLIVTNNWEDVGFYEGIEIIHITDFLLNQ